METKKELVRWEEPRTLKPGTTNYLPIECYALKSDVIRFQKKYAQDEHGHIYSSDKEALDDFLVIHWASVVNNYGPMV